MNRNLKYLFIHKYIDFFEKEYLAVLNSFRTIASMILPVGLYIYTKNADFIWLGLCCFLWALHIFIQNQTGFFFKNMFISLGICTLLQILGFLAHVHIVTYCLFSFFIAFLIPYFAYFKRVILYDISVYFIVQASVFFQKDMLEMSKSILYSIIAFFIVIFIGSYLIRFNLKKEMMYRLKVNLNFLLVYVEMMKQFILTGSKKNYEDLGKQREYLFRSVQVFRDIYPVYTIAYPNDILAKIAPIQERFIETTIGFCVQVRNIHTSQTDEQKIKDRFQKIRDTILRQRGLIFEVQTVALHDLLVRYQSIFAYAQNIEPISNQNTHLSPKELVEINSAIFQFKESMALMEKDIKNTLFTT